MAGYSPTPLAKKLGLKEGQRVRLISAPAGLAEWLDQKSFAEVSAPPYDLVLFFVNRITTMESRLLKLRQEIVQNGMIWVAWYKKSSKKPSEITEDIIRDTAIPLGLVDVKVCAISDDWSGLKLVIRVSERK